MKKMLCVALSFLTIATLTGCGGQQHDPEIFTPTLDKKTTCNIVVAGHYSNFQALETEFDRFNIYYPNVFFKYTKVADYENKLATVLEGNDKPNIFFSEPKMIDNEAYASIASHMEELSDSKLGLNFDCVRSNLINHDKNGKTYMVPIFSRTYGTLVNKNLFRKEGLELPTTWTELLDVCKAFKDKGYENPIMGYSKDKKPVSGLMNVIAYPYFISELSKNPEAIDKANKLEPEAGEYMRKALTAVDSLAKNKCFDVEACDQISDNYEQVLLRFFEGDVPMMVCNGDTVSGAKSRESKSQAFKDNPFKYSFYPIPVTEEGGFFIDSPSVEFSVNKDCDNLDMTNEFMRFLMRTRELDRMALEKGLIASTTTTPFESNYAAFNDIPAERTISPELIGVKDQLVAQIRIASYKVGKGELSIDDAIAMYGKFE